MCPTEPCTTGETPRACTHAKIVISCSTFSNADHGYCYSITFAARSSKASKILQHCTSFFLSGRWRHYSFDAHLYASGKRIHRSTTENFCWDEIRPRDWLNVTRPLSLGAATIKYYGLPGGGSVSTEYHCVHSHKYGM